MADKEKWEVNSDGQIGTFLGEISDDKDFEYDRDNHVTMIWEGTNEVEYQYVEFILLSNNKNCVMMKYQAYADILQRG